MIKCEWRFAEVERGRAWSHRTESVITIAQEEQGSCLCNWPLVLSAWLMIASWLIQQHRAENNVCLRDRRGSKKEQRVTELQSSSLRNQWTRSSVNQTWVKWLSEMFWVCTAGWSERVACACFLVFTDPCTRVCFSNVLLTHRGSLALRNSVSISKWSSLGWGGGFRSHERRGWTWREVVGGQWSNRKRSFLPLVPLPNAQSNPRSHI